MTNASAASGAGISQSEVRAEAITCCPLAVVRHSLDQQDTGLIRVRPRFFRVVASQAT